MYYGYSRWSFVPNLAEGMEDKKNNKGIKKIKLINLKELESFYNYFNIISYFNKKLTILNIKITKYSHHDQKIESYQDKRISSINILIKRIVFVKCNRFFNWFHLISLNSIGISFYNNKWILWNKIIAFLPKKEQYEHDFMTILCHRRVPSNKINFVHYIGTVPRWLVNDLSHHHIYTPFDLAYTAIFEYCNKIESTVRINGIHSLVIYSALFKKIPQTYMDKVCNCWLADLFQ